MLGITAGPFSRRSSTFLLFPGPPQLDACSVSFCLLFIPHTRCPLVTQRAGPAGHAHSPPPPSEEVQSGFLGLIFSADKAVTSASSPVM